MRRKYLFPLLLVWLLPPLNSDAQTPPSLPSMEESIQGLFSQMDQVFLSRLDKVCLEGTLETGGRKIPLGAVIRQDDLSRLEATVMRLDKGSRPQGYFVRLRGPLATLMELPQTEEPLQRRSPELFFISLFDSQFRVGDFISALILQLRFSGLEEKSVSGTKIQELTAQLPVDPSGRARRLTFRVNSASHLPGGFSIIDGDKSRTVQITIYGHYTGKSYAKETEASDQTGRSRLTIDKIYPMRLEVAFIDLSTISLNNWKRICSGS